jgi:ribosome-associated toxin RatA of RatAB toxin-antitoxin module
VAEKTSQTIYIEADPGTVLEVIADIDSYPEWISEYKEAEVQERGVDGYPKVVRFVMDAGVIKDTLVMTYEWPKNRESLSWTLVSSSLLRSLDGSYHLAPKGSGTDVTYELSVDLAIPMI